MESPTPERGMRRQDCVRQALAPYSGKVRIIGFDSSARELKSADELWSGGTTHMSTAFRILVTRKPDYSLVMSDGAVADPEDTLSLARKTSGIIDTLYIGEANPDAEAFMRELAHIGHGRFSTFDLSQKALGFAGAVALMLPPPSGNVIRL